MSFQFLIDTYRTEIQKVLGVWSMFDDADLRVRPNPGDHRGRNLLEHMVHQCVSENFWFESMLDISVTGDPLPRIESRIDFIRAYHRDASMRLQALDKKTKTWWNEITRFFDVQRSHAWIVVRRIAHTAHHRGQQTTLLRVFKRDLHSTYGPTADTGGLMQNHAPVVYAYPTAEDLLREEPAGRFRTPLPPPGNHPVTERPESPKSGMRAICVTKPQ